MKLKPIQSLTEIKRTEDGREVLTISGQIEGESYSDWARRRYEDVIKFINFAAEDGSIDPIKLNQVLSQFSSNFAWTITMQEVESNKLAEMTHQYERWHNELFSAAFRSLREEASGAGRAPAQATVEARIGQMHGEEKEQRLKAIEKQKSCVDLLKGFVKVLDRHATILQTLSSNMRSEMFFASGVNFKGSSTEERNKAVKEILEDAMRKKSEQTEEKQDD